jgi:hypothetical protein
MLGTGGLACLLLIGALGSMSAAPSRPDASPSDPKAIDLANRVLEALGGSRAWEDTRYFQFDFVVEESGVDQSRRSHLWDRYESRLRYERTEQGTLLIVLIDLQTKQGRAFRDGDRLEGEEAAPFLTEAYEAWINDTYWLLMPYKMKDPGVQLTYAGESTEGGTTYDRVLLSFDDVGLTPGDRYWAYINRETGLMERWSYILEDDPPDGPSTAWEWRGWQRRGRLLLSPEKVLIGKGPSYRILHPVLETYDVLPEDYFTLPVALPSPLVR